MARAATSQELIYYRTPGKWSYVYAAILDPPIVYRARVNQTFSSLDQVLSITYDTGSGVLADVLPDMELWVGSSVDSYDKGICRLRDKDGTKFYVSETSEIEFSDNDYLTIVADYSLWARPVRVTVDGTIYMDEVTYTNQHTNWDPMPNMGPHKVAELTGSSVNVGFDASSSFCPGSSISAYAWSCSTASAMAGETTATVTIQFNTVGWHIVYLTLTAANGKSFFGIRYVYIWNDANPPATAIVNSMNVDVERGGWEANITLYQGASLATVHERALVILFSKDFYGEDQVNIGPVPGAENIRFIGWIGKEDNSIFSEVGSVTFNVYGGAHWLNLISSWPDGVELVSSTPTLWTSVQNLTVDLGLYHLFRWRTTLTRIMDVTLTGDTRITNEVNSSSQKLWPQIQEMAWQQIYARSGVNALNQLSVQIHPSLIPSGSRTFPTVMTITMDDIEEGLEIERLILPEVSIVDLSGVIVTAPDTATAKFALSPGHSLPRLGDWDIQTNLLLSSQSQAITLAGLYRSWRNNPFKDIPLSFVAPVALIDCFPNQRCNITIDPASNPRGISFSGGIIPTGIEIEHEPTTGHMRYNISFEAETFESQAREGDVPGSGDTDNPPEPSFPPLPEFPSIVPGIPDVPEGGPKKVVFLDTSGGVIYCENFNADSPTYVQINAGLGTQPWGTSLMYQRIERLYVTPGGAIYVAQIQSLNGFNWEDPTKYAFLARAASPGATFETIIDSIMLEDPVLENKRNGIYAVGVDATVPERIMYCVMPAATQSIQAFVGNPDSGFTAGLSGLPSTGGGDGTGGSVTYGSGRWVYTQNQNYVFISPDGSSSLGSGSSGAMSTPVFNGEAEETYRAATTPILFNVHANFDAFIRSTDNFDTRTTINVPDNIRSLVGFATDPTGNYCAGRWGAGAKGKSTDGGYSWSAFPSLPVGNWYFEFGGMNGSSPTWIAAGAVIRFTPDNGVTWVEKTTSSLTAINPLPSIFAVKVLEY